MKTAASERSLAQTVYDLILERLISNSLAPGERLSVDQLARELQVSQTPIRQALVTLDSERLVTRNPNSGYRVSPLLSKAEFEDLFLVRGLLEPEAARLAARNGDEGALGEIEELQHEMVQAARQYGGVPYASFAKLDGEFHDAIARSSENRPLTESIERLHSQIHIFRLQHEDFMALDAINEHMEIISAIHDRNGEAARRAMKRHLRISRLRFKDVF